MGDKYSISSSSGRLKKKVRVKKEKKKINILNVLFNLIKNPWVIFIFVSIFGYVIYFFMGETGKKSGRSPVKNAENVNQVVREKNLK